EVSGLLAGTEDEARLPFEQAAGEDRDNTRFAVRVLSRSVDVGQGERGEVEPVELLVGTQVVGYDLLGDAVRRHRPLWGGLVDRKHRGVGLAVDGAAARREHDLAGAALTRAFEHVQRADDVDGGIVRRPGNRHPYVDLCGEVEDDLR